MSHTGFCINFLKRNGCHHIIHLSFLLFSIWWTFHVQLYNTLNIYKHWTHFSFSCCFFALRVSSFQTKFLVLSHDTYCTSFSHINLFRVISLLSLKDYSSTVKELHTDTANDLTLGYQTSDSAVVQVFTTGPCLWH